MAIHTNIPLDLTDTHKAHIFQTLDAILQSMILYSLLYGMFIHLQLKYLYLNHIFI